ncbi:MAG TPA: sugar phosphate nucleotidyltransferase [Thermoanaerobaculia bacterium]|nr:sugar phosphate nucleotidyltransferase [Thermoanaerobaculia bacterium]
MRRPESPLSEGAAERDQSGGSAAALLNVAILCGGFGTRLGKLAEGLPKPMIPVGGRPYLERVLESFAENGLRSFVLLTGYRAEVVEEHFGDGEKFGYRIAYSRETEPLGTGGALREARALLGDRFILTYGDVLRRFDYDRFVQQHIGNCLAVYPRLTSGNADVVDDFIVRFNKRAPELPYVDAGFSVMHGSTIDLLPETGPCSFEEIVFANLAEHGGLEGEIVNHDFFDIGTPEELEKTRKALE